MERRFLALFSVICVLACGSAAASGENPPPAQQLAAPAKAVVAHFDILAFQIVGSTKLAVVDIERAVYPFEGPKRTEADVESARAALQALYEKQGFPTVSVSIPSQDAARGLITLQVDEQRIGRLRVVGAKWYSPDDIARAAPSLAEGTVPNFQDVQKDIVALNQLPDRRVTPQITAGEAPGTVDVNLNVDDKLPLHGSLELNNRSSANTSELRLTGTVHYDDLWQEGNSLTLTAQTAPQEPSNARVFSGSYLARFGDSPYSLLGYAVRSDSNVAAISDYNVIGNGTMFGLRLVRTLPGHEGFFNSVSFGIDDKDFNEDTVVAGSTSTAPIHYFPMVAAYNANWMHGSNSTDLGITATANLRGLGSDEEQFDDKRFLAESNFFHLRIDFAHTLTFANGGQLFAHIQSQFSNEPLISNEEFSIGGLDTVRGYLESTAVGDTGVASQLELRTPEMFTGKFDIDDFRALVFFDSGYERIHDPLPEQLASETLASTGIGTTFKMFGHFNGVIDLAAPLSDPANNDTGRKRGRLDFLFRTWGDF